MVYWIAADIVLFLLILLFCRRNRTSLLSGFFLGLFLLLSEVLVFVGLAYTASGFALAVAAVFAVATLLVLLFGGYAFIIYLYANARTVAKKEGRSLSNRLTLILAAALTIYAAVSLLVNPADLPDWMRYTLVGLGGVALFYFFHVLVFLLTAVLCATARPKYDQDYIIVLGSGLVDGRVPPLLGGRIDRAVAFYREQEKRLRPPKLVLSGGQGSDEPVSEASAMRLYALDRGVSDKDILVEDRATNTLENMLFSKLLMDRDSNFAAYRCVYATSRYHLLRAGNYARRAGLKIDGLGAKTARYFVPNAFIREYIAFLAMHKKRFIALAILIFILAVLLAALPDILNAISAAP